jgi:hypothetical protein
LESVVRTWKPSFWASAFSPASRACSAGFEPCGIEKPIVPPPPPPPPPAELELEVDVDPEPLAPEAALELELELEPQAASASVVMSTVPAAISRRRGNERLIVKLLLLNE